MKKKIVLTLCFIVAFHASGYFLSNPMAYGKTQNEKASLSHKTSKTTITKALDLNRATQKELSRLPGIGPKKAATIIAYRKNQPFKSKEDLMKVEGIGKKTFKELRPWIRVK